MISYASALGYVGLVAIEYSLVNTWMAFAVGKARKLYGIKYPQMYARLGDGNCNTETQVNNYNCVQRGHQNTLEGTPTFISLLALSSIKYPLLAAAAGQVWVISRVFYFLGYSTGDPSKRGRGHFGYLGLISLLLLAGGSCARLILEN